MWWVTTSTYRAALQSIDPSIDDVRVPVNLTFYCESEISRSSFEPAIQELIDDNPEVRVNTKFIELSGMLENDKMDPYALNVVLLTQKKFMRQVPTALVDTRGYFKDENQLTVNFMDADSLFLLLSRVLGTERLKSISNLGLQVRV